MGQDVKAVVDEGSKVNVIEEKVILNANIKVDRVTDAQPQPPALIPSLSLVSVTTPSSLMLRGAR